MPSIAPSPHRLTDDQVRFFDENGYLVLRQLITGDLLHQLQDAATTWIEDGQRTTPESPLWVDYSWAKRATGDVLFRVNYLHDKGRPESLALLGSPEVMGVAESLCGPNFVPTYESLVFKMSGDGEAIRWHQDAVHPRQHRIFNFDLYLDPSHADGGALRVIPGTQTTRLDACELERMHGWTPPGAIVVEMEPGDVLLHDVMVVHGSPRTVGKALRRTIYYEFRPAEQIVSEGPWDREWIERRLRLMPAAQAAYARHFPERAVVPWNVTPEFAPAPRPEAETDLKVYHLKHTPGAFCSAGSVPEPPTRA